MRQAIAIKVGGSVFEVELDDSVTGKAIYGALPIRAKAQRWGGEIYFSIPVSCELEEDSREVLEEGELGYWPPGRAFCIFFGPTPASGGDEIRAASAVNQGNNRMSLTTFITEPEVRAQLKKMICRPGFDGGRKLLVPPLTKHYSLVGTAFDYLLRFYLKRVNPQAVERSHWVAETAALCTDALVLDAESGRIEIMPERVTDPDKHKLAVKMQSMINEAKENYRLYLKTGRVTEKLLKSAIGLAKLDVISRTGQPDLVDLAGTDKRDRDDLRKLMKVIPAGDFKAKAVCVLNPTFGEASQLVGGADADVIIDDTLIEVKTVMKCQLQSKYLHELVGYYCLYQIGSVNRVPTDKPLRRLAIYFSRHAYLYTVPVTECWRARDFKAFLRWFEDLIRARA